MNVHQDAKQPAVPRPFSRTLSTLILSLLAMLFPSLSMAAGGENVELAFSQSDQIYLYASLAIGILAIVIAFIMRGAILAQSPGSEKMREVGQAIREGALAYLKQQVKLMAVFVVVLGAGLFILFGYNILVPIAFLAGVLASYIAGYAGMLTAVDGNMRTANAALTSYSKALVTAFRSGAVAGLVTVGMGLLGATIILIVGGNKAMLLLVGFGFGGSLAALFMRVGGGIFTKAADVGADLVGKVEAGIPEDDPRNPATIADNVGDNVGDCAGMAADVFESYEVTLVAAIVLGAATAAIFDQATWMRLVVFALVARAVGIIASIVGIYMVKGSDDINADPLKAIRKGFYASAAVALVATAGVAWYMMGGQNNPIRTTTLVSMDQMREDTVQQVIDARDAYARDKKIPEWQVKAKDLVGVPALANLPVPPNPLLGADVAKENFIDSRIQYAQGFTGTRRPEPIPLTGYSLLTAERAKDLKVAVEPDSLSLPANAGTPETKAIDLHEAMTQNRLDLVVAELNIKQRAQGGPGQDLSIVVGPTSKSRLEKLVKDEMDRQRQSAPNGQPASEISIKRTVDTKLYANKEGKIVVGLTEMIGDPESLGQARGPIASFRYTPMAAADLNKAREEAQAKNELPATPVGITATVAKVEGTVVPWYLFFIAIAFGVFMAFAIEALTDYYVSTHKKPTQEVAGVATAGPAPMIIQGFAYAAESSVFMVVAIVVALLVPLYLFNPALYGGYLLSFYGIALVGLGLLTTTGYVLAMDTFGPISDNAQGVFEMSGAGEDNEYGSKAVQRLDAAGNTTKALTKGFAIATAVVAAVALFHSYLEAAKLGDLGLRLDIPEIFLGLMIGGAAPFLFAAFSINAVGRASFQLINEVRRQFKADPGIMAGTSKPNYASCVAIVTAAAQKELLGPGILAVALPVAVAFGFAIGKDPVTINGELYNLTGAQALGGFLAGTILSGQLMAVLLANSGGMWDNSKKIIEDGLHGGKGTEAHKAAVVCDTVGDPFKDTAGPAMNPLIKVMNLVALLLAPVVIQPYSTMVLGIVTGVSLLLLAIAIYVSKKGSISTEMQKVSVAAEKVAEHESALEMPAVEPPVKKKRITVDDEDETTTPQP